MMNLIITIMAIALASLLAVGGASYFDGGTSTRIIGSRAFETQFQAITSAMSTYRAANNGLSPPSGSDVETRIAGYLPHGRLPSLPVGLRDFRWRSVQVRKLDETDLARTSPALCLDRPSGAVIEPAIVDAVVRFASGQADEFSVAMADDCELGGSSEGVADPGSMAEAVRGWGARSLSLIIWER